MLRSVFLAGLTASALAACATETRTVAVVEDVCWTYGFRVGSPEYRECQQREAANRRSGRAYRGYTEAMLISDAQAACQSYGLTRYSDRYDRCVRHEYAARQPI